MPQRKDIEWGKDIPPAQSWGEYRRTLQQAVVDSITAARLREGYQVPEETPGK